MFKTLKTDLKNLILLRSKKDHMETCPVIFKNIHQNIVQKMLQNKVKLLQTKNILRNEAFDVNQSIHCELNFQIFYY